MDKGEGNRERGLNQGQFRGMEFPRHRDKGSDARWRVGRVPEFETKGKGRDSRGVVKGNGEKGSETCACRDQKKPTKQALCVMEEEKRVDKNFGRRVLGETVEWEN